MICPGCQARLAHLNAAGEPMVRNHGMVFKADGVVLVCPRCKGDVPMTPDLTQALQRRLVVFRRPAGKPP